MHVIGLDKLVYWLARENFHFHNALFDVHVHVTKAFPQVLNVTYIFEVLFELVGSAAGGTDAGGEAREALGLREIDEGHHLRGGEPDEVDAALPTPELLVRHLQVFIPDSCLSVRLVSCTDFQFYCTYPNGLKYSSLRRLGHNKGGGGNN